MPVYEYMCKKCNKITEQWTNIYECIDLIVCPNCGETAHKIISQSTFALKGGGWYAEGYNKGKNGNETQG
jgi:putative FmdB family regulatory protein